MEAFIGTPPAIFGVGTFLASIAFGHVEVAVEAPPVVLGVSALAGVSLGVIEITVVASPTILSVSAFAGISFGVVPPVCRVGASAASLHSVAGWVAEVAGGACPVIFCVFAGTGVALVYVFFAILALPTHFF